jgi:hypothetical protein
MEECIRRADRMIEFQPETWIDHGTGDYLFSRRATMPDGTPLAKFLQPRGIRNYWSYSDYWLNPCERLTGWAPIPLSQALADVTASLARVDRNARRITAQSIYLLAHGLKNLIGERTLEEIKKHPGSIDSWMGISQGRRSRRSLNTEPMVLYTESGSIFASDLEGIWIFDTVLLNHLALQFRPALTSGLGASSTVLIGHTYLGAQFPHMTATALERDRVKLDSRFVEGIEHIASLQRERLLTSLPFSTLRMNLTEFVRTRTVRTGSGWEVHSPEPAPRLFVGASKTFCSTVEGVAQPIKLAGRLIMPINARARVPH